jgi:ribosomal protein S18 acetylase RimI-like enzyme
MNELRFHTIDLQHDADRCLAFARDAYTCSFGSDALLVQEFGADGRGYVEWLRARIEQFPAGHVLACDGTEVIGQITMIPRQDPPDSGYINLFYLAPSSRGTGHGKELHDYALRVFRDRGARLLRLSVSPTNPRAMRFYRKHGWRDLGLVQGRSVHLFELAL